MHRTYSVAEAKAQFSACIRTVEAGNPVVITRKGRPVAAMVTTEDLEAIERLRKAGPQAGLHSLAGGWGGSEELADLLDEIQRTGPRQPVHLD